MNTTKFQCPKKLLYQFNEAFNIKISDKCCKELKKDPFKKYEKENKRTIAITGMQKEEGGQRAHLQCIITRRNKIVKFHPLSVVSGDWENWFIEKYNIQLCELYYPPYNFVRTGCKGCPYSYWLQEQLDTMQKYMPEERKQCEYIWEPIYKEYRRIGYRLRANDETLFNYGDKNE